MLLNVDDFRNLCSWEISGVGDEERLGHSSNVCLFEFAAISLIDVPISTIGWQ